MTAPVDVSSPDAASRSDLPDLVDAASADLASRSDLPDLVDVDGIERLVRDFYREVAMDDLLGPVFRAAGVDWSAHTSTMVEFWSWQLLGIPGYTGNPLRAHEPSHRRTPFTRAHHERWIERFTETIDASFAGPGADLALRRARKMNDALARLLAGVVDDPDQAGHCPVEPMIARHR